MTCIRAHEAVGGEVSCIHASSGDLCEQLFKVAQLQNGRQLDCKLSANLPAQRAFCRYDGRTPKALLQGTYARNESSVVWTRAVE